MYLILLLLLISSHTLSAQQCAQAEYKIRGLDVDESAEDDNEFALPTTDIIEAARRGDFATVVQLAQHNTINQQDTAGNTAFSEAAYHGHEKVAAFLLTYGAQINKPNNNGDTPLMRVAEKNNIGMLQFLLQNKANPLIKNNKNRTARTIVSMQGSKAGRTLFEAAEKRWNDRTNNFKIAINNNLPNVFSKLLIEGEISFELTAGDGASLMYAAQSANPFFLQELLSLPLTIRPNVNIRRTSDGWSPTRIAVSYCSQPSMPDKIRLLIKAGAEFTPEVYATINTHCSWAQKNIIEAILKEKKAKEDRREQTRARLMQQQLQQLHAQLTALAQAI